DQSTGQSAAGAAGNQRVGGVASLIELVSRTEAGALVGESSAQSCGSPAPASPIRWAGVAQFIAQCEKVPLEGRRSAQPPGRGASGRGTISGSSLAESVRARAGCRSYQTAR